MNPLICPKCGGNLEKIIYQDIEVDRCCQCQGIWFDSLEAEQLKSIKGSESIDSGNFQGENAAQSLQESVNCPRCQEKMLKMLDFDKYPIWYETCLKCHGLWFDAGEFQQFKHNFQNKGLLDRAIKILRFNKKMT